MLDAANDRPAPLTPSSSERPEVTPGNGASRGPLVGGVEHCRSQHTTDADCTVGDDLCCTICGVSHGGAACGECGGVAFHRDGCGEIEDAPPARRVALYRCDACPYETRDPGDGCCPCERSLGGVEIACTGTLVTVPLWCAGCQGEVGELAVVGDATGPLCHKCADERMARTQRIPTLTIRETAAMWLAEQAVRP